MRCTMASNYAGGIRSNGKSLNGSWNDFAWQKISKRAHKVSQTPETGVGNRGGGRKNLFLEKFNFVFLLRSSRSRMNPNDSYLLDTLQESQRALFLPALVSLQSLHKSLRLSSLISLQGDHEWDLFLLLFLPAHLEQQHKHFDEATSEEKEKLFLDFSQFFSCRVALVKLFVFLCFQARRKHFRKILERKG